MSLRWVMIVSLVLAACSAKEETPTPDTTKAASVSSAKQVALAYMDAWNRHDSAAIDTLIAPEGSHVDVPSGFAATGPRGVHMMMKDMTQALPDYVWTATDVIEGDPQLAIRWTWKGTFTGKNPTGQMVAGQRVSGEGMSLVVVENGKIKLMKNYYDEASLFKTSRPIG